MEPTNVCLWCGKDCSFLATCQGVCLPCGDKMQEVPTLELIKSLAKAVARVKQLEASLSQPAAS